MQGAHRPAVPMGHHRHRSVSGHTQCASGSGGGNIRPDLASYHRRTSGCLCRTWHGCRARSSGSRGLHFGQRRAQHGAGVCRGLLQTSATYRDFGLYAYDAPGVPTQRRPAALRIPVAPGLQVIPGSPAQSLTNPPGCPYIDYEHLKAFEIVYRKISI